MNMFNSNDREPENSFEGGFSVDTSIAENDISAAAHETASKEPLNSTLLEWLEIIVSAIIAVIIIFGLVFRLSTIDGKSMQNTLHHNDKVIISNLFYTPRQGDIVVISRNIENTVEGQETSEMPIIKRVIAVGGQTVDIDFKKGIVYVDGVALKEDYISTPTVTHSDVEFPIYVPEGHIFVLGDNRCDSLDSRSSRIGNGGLVDTRYVLGHAVYRIFPFNKIGKLD